MLPSKDATPIELPEKLTVKQFSDITNISLVDVIKTLMKFDEYISANEPLDLRLAIKVAKVHKIQIWKPPIKEKNSLLAKKKLKVAHTKGVIKPPVVVVMGHVDHGKTTLLDTIRGTKVATKEKGGITQSTGAYQVGEGNNKITFIDTPGHKAFTEMRATGTFVTDIAILVVAADDGVKPQTLEALDHIFAANVPFVVAINKIDAEGANLNRVKSELAANNILLEENGGNVPVVEISALKNIGLSELLETILLLRDVEDIKAPVDSLGEAVVIESRIDRHTGIVASSIVKSGTLRQSDFVTVGRDVGKIRFMKNFEGRTIKKAKPADPVEIFGLSNQPKMGDTIKVESSAKIAKSKALTHKKYTHETKHAASLQQMQRPAKLTTEKILSIVLKAATQGSVNALNREIQNSDIKGYKIKILHESVGSVNEADILLASSGSGLLVRFGTEIEPSAATVAARENIVISSVDVIYEVVDIIENYIKSSEKSDIFKTPTAEANIIATFNHSKYKQIAGIKVVKGEAIKDSVAEIVRNGKKLHRGKIVSLRHIKSDVQKLSTNMEGGVAFAKFHNFRIGDEIKFYKQTNR